MSLERGEGHPGNSRKHGRIFSRPLMKSDFSSHNSSQVIALRWKRAREISRWNFHGWSRASL